MKVAARRGISEMFVNLARRNQALLHRQLSLLDTMERRTEDPAELSDLFRLDHLATRMRRHAEGLVMSGRRLRPEGTSVRPPTSRPLSGTRERRDPRHQRRRSMTLRHRTTSYDYSLCKVGIKVVRLS
nr:hypothetical protein [Actinomadura terrae]